MNYLSSNISSWIIDVFPEVSPVAHDKKTFTFILFKAREFLDSDPSSAKAWLITAKTLFPKEFSVQFEAYAIEKAAGNVKQAGLLLKDLVFR